jgi:hypothetical protein
MKYTVEVDYSGNVYWYEERTNIQHREGGPAVESNNGSKLWYSHGKLHREGGPAAEYVSGYKEWYVHGLLHREDGPAVECCDGIHYWYLNNEQYSEEEFNKKIEAMKKDCSGKVVNIDGKKYKLVEI